jgi:HEAT repeat protein
MLKAEGRPAVPALLKALETGDEGLCDAACRALANIGVKDKSFMSALIAVLKDKKRVANRCMAASALGEMGAEAKGAVPDLIEALRAKDVADPQAANKTRQSVMAGLARIGRDAKAAVPALIAFVQDQSMDPCVRRSAAEALGSMGPAAFSAKAALAKAVKDTDPGVRMAAAKALQGIGP